MEHCALCGEIKDLQQSHIIPALVYRRVRSHKNSKFRSIDNFGKEMQDGEKHTMLCHECEELFSIHETWFAKNVLDPFLNKGIFTFVDKTKFDSYVISVAWRVLWDDLYRLDSFVGMAFRKEFQEFELRLKNYILGRSNKKCFSNHVFSLHDLISCSKSLSDGAMFGFSAYDPIYGVFIIVYYADIVYATKYEDDRRSVIVLDDEIPKFEGIIAQHLVSVFENMKKAIDENVTPEFIEKMEKRYNDSY